MDALLYWLFGMAVQLSGLPAMETPPPVEAMPYQAMLREVCADLKEDTEWDRARAATMLSSSAMSAPGSGNYAECMAQSGLMAAYLQEQRRIVYRDDLDLDDDADNSFIVHEFVHALQDRKYHGHMFDTCAGVIAAERQAYLVQDLYLQARGQMLRVGERLRYVSCNRIF